MYWLSMFCPALEQGEYTGDGIDALLVAMQADHCKDKTEGSCAAAARALKEMAPIFDKRRSQVVAIWFSEYISTAKKFEELNQRQMKYDYYRLKYWRYFIVLLQENAEYGRLKEVEMWVLACEEDHDVIDIMLSIVLKARGLVLRMRLLEVLNRAEGVGIDSAVDAIGQIQSPGGDRFARDFLKELAKAYTYYLDLLNAQLRLARVMDDCELWLEKAQLSMVALFLVCVMKYPSEMVLLQEDAVIMDHEFHANVIVIKQALVRHELPSRMFDAQGQEAWKMYWTAVNSFCENKWPERVSKGKSLKKLLRPRTAGAVASVIASSSAGACQLSSTGSSS
uniref:Nuclear pore complex protein Nup85 n=1 Tax=Peronospora matthiolae TaxID=2874970 RepID=A0AAV1VH97_9STRA